MSRLGMFNFLKGFTSKEKDVDLMQDAIYNEMERAMLDNAGNSLNNLSLPLYYGKGLPERVVELFLAKKIFKSAYSVLDVAHANSMLCHRKMLKSLPIPKNVTGIDIAIPTYDTSGIYENSIYGDITKTEFSDESFDIIWCISSLEHFGMDNSGYTSNYNIQEEADLKALKEMLRILKSGGSILITVPYGKYENHGWFRNYDEEHWRPLINYAIQYGIVNEFYFGHTYGEGWRKCSPDELKYVGYYNQNNKGSGALAAIYFTKNIL